MGKIPNYDAAPSTTKRFTAGVTDPGGITFPILQADTIFKLLLGQPATLFLVELPQLGFEFFYRQVIPIWGPLAATFGGGISAGIDLGFGYDTLGLTQTIATKNPAYLLNGFFLNDVDPATGADRNEAWISAQIFVGAALSFGGVCTVGVEGGIEATINFNLNDPDGDTKVRFSEMSSNLVANSFNPLAVFDVSGMIEFFMRAFLEINLFIFKFSAEFEFLRLTLFEFDIPFNRPGVLASQSGDTLTLNIGPNASARLQGDISDGNETIHAESDGSGNVVVWSDQFNVDKFSASTNPFTGVSKIVVIGGAGNDTIDLVGLQGDVKADIQGGDGVDTITGGGGDDSILGDAGDDVITGGGGADTIRGGVGADTLKGGAGADKIYGEDGNDVLYGHGTADADDGALDTLDGGLGDDTVHRSLGGDITDLASAGSIDIILDTSGTPILDFSDKGVPVTFFIKDGRIVAGFGEQHATTAQILAAAFTFTDMASLQTNLTFGGALAFDSIVGVADASGVSKIIGSTEPDKFHVQETPTGAILVLDGGTGADRYYFYADPTGANPIRAKVWDVGENLKDENVIQVIGSNGIDKITVTGGATEGAVLLNDKVLVTQKQEVIYVPPSSDPATFTDQLILRISADNVDPSLGGSGSGGDDLVTVRSTSQMVPVRVEGGPGDDTVIVGGATGSVLGVDGVLSFLNPNANQGTGLGPLVLVGGYFNTSTSQYVDTGHDTVIVDDSQDTDAAPQNKGNLNAFLEIREGFDTPFEVGIVSGLGMRLSQIDDNGTPLNLLDDYVYVTDGRVEFEAFEVLDVRMGTQDDLLTIGGGYNLDKLSVNGGEGDPDLVINSELPKNRLVSPAEVLITESTKGTGSKNEIQKVLVSNAIGGTFTLTFSGQTTTPLDFDASAADVENALQALSTLPNVSVSKTITADGNTNFSVTFVDPGNTDVALLTADYANLVSDPNAAGITEILHTFSGMTLVSGGAGDDEIRVIDTQDLSQGDAGDKTGGLLEINTTTQGVKGVTDEVVTLSIGAEVGYFVLEFASGSDDTVPGAEQTIPLPFTATAGEIQAALEKMRLVGTGFVKSVTGSDGSFTITFDKQLGNMPQLRAYATQLLIRGDAGEDRFHIQSIDQPTYLLGGDDADAINLNVEIVATDASGVTPVQPPEPLFVPIPDQATANGVNDLLTADGQRGGDAYLAYLFGGIINSQINLFDSGLPNEGTDSSIVLGTQFEDLFLLRAAVAADGLAFVAMLKKAEIETVVNGHAGGNEVQALTVQPGGTVVLSLTDPSIHGGNRQTTNMIFLVEEGNGAQTAEQINAALIEAELEKFIGVPNVTVAASADGRKYLITFVNPGNRNISQLVVEDGVGHVERVNYTAALDSMKVFGLAGSDRFGIDDVRIDMKIYGGQGEEFFQVGQLYKSKRNAAAGVPYADVFATIETTRGYLSNGTKAPLTIFGGDDGDEFVVYHNLAPLPLYGDDGDDSFLIRAFALVGSQEDLRERTDVSGDAGADLISTR